MTNALKDRVALITGGTSGIGLACAQRFANEGATVIAFDLKETEGWTSFVKSHPAASFYKIDVTDGPAQKAAVAEIEAKYGAIDVLVTAAGVGEAGPITMVDQTQWQRVIDINLNGTFLSAQAVLEGMMKKGKGSIITVASIEGLVANEGGGAYNASKGGVVLLSKNIAMDYGRKGVRCNVICPGFIETPMFDDIMNDSSMAEVRASVQNQIKIGRFGKPEEIAAAANFLASDDASYITGHSLVVDGGYTAGHSHGIVQMLGLG